jgi:predicted RNA binding protein YcfA (HicA-like mRNA interferase family)
MVDFAPRLKQILREAGFEFVRHGKGDHEIWRHPTKGLQVTVDLKGKSRHTANQILKGAGLPKAF